MSDSEYEYVDGTKHECGGDHNGTNRGGESLSIATLTAGRCAMSYKEEVGAWVCIWCKAEMREVDD